LRVTPAHGAPAPLPGARRVAVGEWVAIESLPDGAALVVELPPGQPPHEREHAPAVVAA